MDVNDGPAGESGGLPCELEELLSGSVVLGELPLESSQFGLGQQRSSLSTFLPMNKWVRLTGIVLQAMRSRTAM